MSTIWKREPNHREVSPSLATSASLPVDAVSDPRAVNPPLFSSTGLYRPLNILGRYRDGGMGGGRDSNRFCFHWRGRLTRPRVLLGQNTWESLAFSDYNLVDDTQDSKALPISPASSPHFAPIIPTHPDCLELPAPRSPESSSASY